jgi:hypothetical protein
MICALLLGSFVAAPVLADNNEADFMNRLNAGGAAIAGQQDAYRARQAADNSGPAAAYKSRALIDHVFEAMNDGNEVGGVIVEYAKANGVVPKLSASLPDYPRVLAPLIAGAVAGPMYADMPDCSEKEYMRLSLQARAWLELGGDKSALPVIEPLNGYKDQTMADRFNIWLQNGSESALEKVGQATKTQSVVDLSASEKDPAKLKAYEAANKRFTDFMMAEHEWRQTNSFRLQ